jgi:hypothetical protein
MLSVIFKTLKISSVIDEETNRSMMFNNIRKNISWVNTIVKVNLYITFNYHVNIRIIVKIMRRNSFMLTKFWYENFKNFKRLMLILDVTTRWNSQYDMLIRFQDLRSTIQWWLFKEKTAYSILFFQEMKWTQIKYLIQFLKFIKNVIYYLSQIKTITIHKIWETYDNLFNHLKNKKKEARKIFKFLWTNTLNEIVEARRVKLTMYNDKTKQFFKRFLNFVIILNSKIKLKLYRVNRFITINYHTQFCLHRSKLKWREHVLC